MAPARTLRDAETGIVERHVRDLGAARAAALAAALGEAGWRGVLGGGDDYELCFAVSPQRVALLPDATAVGVSLTRIGVVCAGEGIELRPGDTVMQFSAAAFDHCGV